MNLLIFLSLTVLPQIIQSILISVDFILLASSTFIAQHSAR